MVIFSDRDKCILDTYATKRKYTILLTNATLIVFFTFVTNSLNHPHTKLHTQVTFIMCTNVLKTADVLEMLVGY